MGNILVITDNLNAPPRYFCLDRYRHDIHWTGSGKNGEESKQVHFYFCKHIAAFCQASTQKQMHLHRYTKKPLKIQGFHRAADGNRTFQMSEKLLKSRRNAHCLPCVYRLSTTWKSKRKAVKGSAEQIYFTPLLLVIEVDNIPKL